jgi:hypothetical protein
MSRYDDILAALATLLGTIRVFNSYQTDGGLHVHKNLEYQTAPADTPCIIYYPGDVTDSLDGDPPPSNGEENHTFPVRIEGIISDTERGDQGELLRIDILRALKSDRLLGGLTEGHGSSISSSSAIEDAGDQGFLGFVQVDLAIHYVTLYGEQ